MIDDLDFESYKYFPALRTRQAELKGLQELNQERKAKVLPLLTLGKWRQSPDFCRSAEKADESMTGLPFFLDLTTDGRHLAEKISQLRDSSNGFRAWRNFANQYDRAIPVVQFANGARIRDVVRQATAIEEEKGKVGFRIRDFGADVTPVVSALSAMEDPRNAMVFVDCEYIRGAVAAYVAAAVSTINALRTEFPESFVCVLSTSFPASTMPFADASQQRGSIDILERDLHARVGGYSVASYGDHGSIHSVIYDDVPIMRWVPRIDYPRESDWYFERRPGTSPDSGYQSAAQALVELDDEIGTRDIWGEQKIIETANGSHLARAPGPWIAARVNIHLSRQIDLSDRLNANDPYDNDDYEDLA